MSRVSVWYADGPGAPRCSPAKALELAGYPAETEAEVTLGWTLEHHPWIDDPGFRARTFVAGYALDRSVADGRVTALSVRLSAVAARIESNPPDVAVVSAVRRGERLAFGTSVGWADVLARVARRVVAEVDETGDDLDAPEVVGNVVANACRPAAPVAAPAASRPADEIDLRIGALVAGLLPEAPTLQFGPGGIGEGIARALDRPVRVWTGLLTEAMADLHARRLLVDPVVATYAWGGESVRELHAAGMLRLVPSAVTHDLTAVSAIPRFVGCNTALQVGLDGAVNIERIGARVIAPLGGHSDFCLAATRSPGGMSVIALRSVTSKGASTIVPRVDHVSTQRSDIDVVVTEHGIAELRGIDDTERARRLVAIAAPAHRPALEETIA